MLNVKAFPGNGGGFFIGVIQKPWDIDLGTIRT